MSCVRVKENQNSIFLVRRMIGEAICASRKESSEHKEVADFKELC